jgi:3-phenylpropionate/cinnamic acid dioxygenase small subunit
LTYVHVKTPECVLNATSMYMRTARLLDEGDFAGFVSLCTDDISYIVTTRGADRAESPLSLINDNHDRLRGRAQSISRYWHSEKPPTQTRHFISNIDACEQADGAISASAYLMLTASRNAKQSIFTGYYKDRLVIREGTLLLRERRVVLDMDVMVDGKVTFIF